MASFANFQLLLIASCLFISIKAEYTLEDTVVVLDDNNLQQAIEEFEFFLLDIYAPWCVHCNQLAPHIVSASKKLNELNSPVKIAKLNGEQNQGVRKYVQFTAYPTLYFFTKGKPEEFDGGRKADDIVEWIRKRQINFPIGAINYEKQICGYSLLHFEGRQRILTLCQIHKVINNNSIIYSSNHDDLTFAHTFNKSVSSEAKVYGNKFVIFKKEYDHSVPQKIEFRGPAFKDELLDQFLEKHSYPTVFEFGMRAAKKIFNEKSPAIILFYKQRKNETLPGYLNYFQKVAEKLKGQLVFCRANLKNKEEQPLFHYLQINTTQIPSIRIIQVKENNNIEQYLMVRPITEENILDFIQQHNNKQTKPYQPSQSELPKDGDFYQLNAKNFWNTIEQAKQNMLVFFYTKLHQISGNDYKQLEDLSNEITDVTFARMDVSLNQVIDFKIYNTPSLFLFKVGQKEPIEYFGSIDKEQEGIWGGYKQIIIQRVQIKKE